MTETVSVVSYGDNALAPDGIPTNGKVHLIHDDLEGALKEWDGSRSNSGVLNRFRIRLRRLDDLAEETAVRLATKEEDKRSYTSDEVNTPYYLTEKSRRARRFYLNHRYGGKQSWDISRTQKYFAQAGIEIKHREMVELRRQAEALGFSPSPHNLQRLGLFSAIQVSRLAYQHPQQLAPEGNYRLKDRTSHYERRGTTMPPQYTRRQPNKKLKVTGPFVGQRLEICAVPGINPVADLSRLGYRY